MNFHIELETDGRWLVEVPEIPGVLTSGATANVAMAKAEVLAKHDENYMPPEVKASLKQQLDTTTGQK
jgi:cytochrome c-type biogenesis protein CcmE